MATEKLNETPEILQSEIEIKMRSADVHLLEKNINLQRDRLIKRLAIEILGSTYARTRFADFMNSVK